MRKSFLKSSSNSQIITFKLLVFSILMVLSACSTKVQHIKSDHQEQWLWNVRYNPDLNLLATGGTGEDLRIFSLNDKSEDLIIPVEGTITQLAWHPTNKLLAVSTQGGDAQNNQVRSFIFNLEGNERQDLAGINTFGARAIGWNHSGDMVAVGDYDGMITIFDKEAKEISRVDLMQKGIMALDWHPSKNVLVAVGEHISIYNFEEGTIRKIEDRKEDVLMLCTRWHPSGNSFVTGDYGDHQLNYPPLLQFWSETGALESSIKLSKAEYRNLAWSNDDTILATASDRVRLWNIEGELLKETQSPNLFWGIDWIEKENLIITTDKDGKIALWDADLHFVKTLNH